MHSIIKSILYGADLVPPPSYVTKECTARAHADGLIKTLQASSNDSHGTSPMHKDL